MNKAAVSILAALYVAGATAHVAAQSFPTKPVRIVVPFTPGSPLEVVARSVAPRMSELLGQPVIIENRGGAGGRIGSASVAHAAPDGHTLVIGSSGTHVATLFLAKNNLYDPLKEFTPISLAVETTNCIVVHPGVPVQTMLDLIAYAKQHPGKIAYASNGVGSVYHLAGELLKQAAGIDLLHVPLQGAGDALNAVVGGHVQMTFLPAANIKTYVTTGKLRALAVNGTRPYAGLPGIPPLSDVVPGYEPVSSWYGFFGPARIPPEILARLHASIAAALLDAEVHTKLEDMGLRVVASTPAEFAAAMKKSFETYGKAVKIAGLQPE